MPEPEEYLGDSVYATNDGFHVILTTNNGEGPLDTIYLDPDVLAALVKYVERIRGKNNPAAG